MQHSSSDTHGSAFMCGVRALLPMLAGVAPFGVIFGVTALQAGLSPLAAQAMSTILFAGASQFMLVQMAAGGVPVPIAFGAIGLINARHALYSASIAPVLAALPMRWKVLLAYLLTDEAYAASVGHLMRRPPSPHAHWLLLGSGFSLWAGWQAATVVGIALGSYLPANLDLDFALPLTFIAIVVPMLKERSHFAAALVAATSALLLADLPFKLGLLGAAITGLVAGSQLMRRNKSS